jgi:hypothetical protein
MPFRLFYLLTLLWQNAVFPQAPAPARQSSSAASPEMEKLAKVLVGEWETVETMEPDDPWPLGASRKGSVTARIVSGGYALVYEVHSNGSAGRLDGFLTIWWERSANVYRLLACFNNPRNACKMRGSAHWEGQALVNDYEEAVLGKATPFQDTFTFTPGSHKLVAAMKSGGTMKTMITTDAKRVVASSQQARAAATSALVAGSRMSAGEFNTLMSRLGSAWNSNDARLAADCFTEDAIYSSPPSARVRQGREALFEFFGGSQGRPRPMHMEWHHVIFDEANQLGAAEYTFSYEARTHGMVIVKIREGKIANWREYEVESSASWEEIVGSNPF